MFELLVFISFVDCFDSDCLSDEKKRIMEEIKDDAKKQYDNEQKEIISDYYNTANDETKSYYDKCAKYKDEYYLAKDFKNKEALLKKCIEFVHENERNEIQEYALRMKNISVSIVRDSMIDYAIRVDNERFLNYICEFSMIESVFDIKSLETLKSFTISETQTQANPK